jgi:hypothetical protein
VLTGVFLSPTFLGKNIMASAIESSVVGFQTTFVGNFGSAPSWLQALLSALEAALPAILAGCGVAAAPASIQDAVTSMPVSTTIKFLGVCRNAGVPLGERLAAATALSKTIKVTPDTDMTNLLAFAQAS